MATYDRTKAEDSPSANGDRGYPVLAVQKASPADLADTDGDFALVQMKDGRVWTSAKIDTALPAGTNAIGKLSPNDGVDVGDVTVNNAGGASAVNIQDGGNSITVDATALPLPTGAATEATLATRAAAAQLPGSLVSGRLDTNTGSWLGSTAPTVGQKAMADSVPVVVASDQSSLPVTGPLTDAQLRATPVPVSGTVTVTDGSGPLTVDGTVSISGSVAVTGPLTDAQLRASAVPVSASSLPLPTGAATEATLSSINTKTPALGQTTMAGSSPVVIASNQTAVPVSGPLTDTELRAAAVPVSAASLPLPTGAATEATLATRAASSQLPGTLVGGRLDVNAGAWLGSTAPTVGQKAMASSIPVALASDQSSLPVTVNVGKAEDSIASSGDFGVPVLGVHRNDLDGASAPEGDYATLNIDAKGRVQVAPGALHVVEDMSSTTGWTALNDDTANIASTTNHVTDTAAITFDKVDGSANTVFGMIQKTVTSFSVQNLFIGQTFVQTTMLIPTLADTVNVVIRLGTDASNYNEWKIPTDTATANIFQVFRVLMNRSQGSTGNGWNPAAITYVAVGVEFNAQNDTLAGIIVDAMTIIGGQLNSADTASEVTTTATTANINLLKIGGAVVDRNIGNASNGSQRVVIASDDVNLSAQTTALQIIDDWDESDRAKVNPIVGQAGVQGNTGTVTATTQRVVLATDVALPAGTNAIGKLAANDGVDIGDVTINNAAGAAAVNIQDGGNSITTDSAQLPAALVGGRLDANAGAWLGSTAPTVGQKAMANSVPVVVASDQSTLPISAASLPLPTGAATEATLATRVADATITARLGVLGQAAMAASAPVVIASNQSAVPVSGPLTDTQLRATAVPVSVASLPLPSGAATEASLAKLTIAQGAALGSNTQALAGASVTTAAPSYTTGQVSPLSLTTSGALRTDSSAVTQPVSAASLPLPAGAATEATLATRAASSQLPGALVGGRLDANVGAIGNVAPSALADDESATPTAPRVGAVLMGMDSSGAANIDRARLAKAHDMDSGAGTEIAVGVTLRKTASGGSVEYGTLADPIRTDPTGTTTQPVSGTVTIGTSVTPGTGATNLGKAEDALHTTGDVGVMALGVANTSAANVSGSNADYTPFTTDNTGAVRTIVEARTVTVLSSASRTSTQTQADQTNITGIGLAVVLDITSAGTGSITLAIQVKDAVSGKYVALLTGNAETSNVTRRYIVYPGITVTANESAANVLSRTWRVVVTHNNANAITYSVGAEVLP